MEGDLGGAVFSAPTWSMRISRTPGWIRRRSTRARMKGVNLHAVTEQHQFAGADLRMPAGRQDLLEAGKLQTEVRFPCW